MVKAGRGDLSLLMKSLLSMLVVVFFSWLEEGVLCGLGTRAVVLKVFSKEVIFIFFALLVTEVQIVARIARGGLEKSRGR
jgi:hypothetical protein